MNNITSHRYQSFDLHSSSSKSKPLTICGGLVWNYQSIWLPSLANSTFSFVASSSSNIVNTNAERKREQFEQLKRSAQEIMKARNRKRARYGPCKGPITVNSFLKTEFMDCFSTKTVPEVMKGLPLPLKYDVKMQENRKMLGQTGHSVPTETHFSPQPETRKKSAEGIDKPMHPAEEKGANIARKVTSGNIAVQLVPSDEVPIKLVMA